MERFAFKIDKVLKANLYKICRLCGIDNPDKVPILANETQDDIFDVDAEPELSQKINDLIGISVYRDDKMPQFICTICVDKINDFYEFREMCYSTDAQTRKLLGIKSIPKKNSQIKLEVKTEALPAEKPKKSDKNGRKRKLEDIGTEIKEEVEKTTNSVTLSKKKMRLALSKQKNQLQPVSTEVVKVEVKNEPVAENVKANSSKTKTNTTATTTKSQVVNPSAPPTIETEVKLKQLCGICSQRFTTKNKLNQHRVAEHSPLIARHFCTTCDEEIKKSSDYKSHTLWHKLTKTAYTCGLCGESMLTVNLFTRHLSNHSQKLATPLLTFDRQCPLCHETFITNFLYNTHTCAIRTKKCGGCNRKMNTEIDHLRHAALCDKTYLVASKHIGGNTETIRIKNENDAEAAAETVTHNISVPLTMMPVVSLTRLSIEPPLKRIGNENTNITPTSKSKKSGKKGMSKKDLKRVDDLLKSTMDTLVSIKHEPEINVDAEPHSHTPQPSAQIERTTSAADNQDDNDDAAGSMHFGDDDFHNQDDDSNHSNVDASLIPIVQLHTDNDINVKQEPNTNQEEFQNLEKNTNTSRTNVVTIKKELPDNGYENSEKSATKIPVLKLKITKEHGTLNSSLINNSTETREKKKKKKKRKDAEKTNEQTDNNQFTSSIEKSPTEVCETTTMPIPGIIRVKQERLDDGYNEGNTINVQQQQQPEATIMTSIPIMQFQIANVCSGVEFDKTDGNKETETDFNEQIEQQQLEEQEDVKPNIAELERLLAIENTTTTDEIQDKEHEGIGNKESEEEEFIASKSNQSKEHKTKQQPRRPPPKRVATKSTSKKANINNNNIPTTSSSSILQMPQIVAVSSGVEMATEDERQTNEFPINIRIKSEPQDDDYYKQNTEPMDYENDNHNETATEMNTDENMPYEDNLMSTLNNTVDEADEQAYINSIDFSNIRIKQEKDIEISESQLTSQQYNGTMSSNILINQNEDGSGSAAIENEEDEDDDDEENDDEDEDDDDEEDEDEDEEMTAFEEKREYREIDWPPLLGQPTNETTEAVEVTQVTKSIQPSLGLTIANVCSQIAEIQPGNEPIKTQSETAQIKEQHKNVIESQTSKAVLPENPQISVTQNDSVHSIPEMDLCSLNSQNVETNLLSQISKPLETPQQISAIENTSIQAETNFVPQIESPEKALTLTNNALSAQTNFNSTVNNNPTPNEAEKLAETIPSHSISGIITEYQENSLKAQPVRQQESNKLSESTHINTDSDSQTSSIDEEQQNILNHEMHETHTNNSNTTSNEPTFNNEQTMSTFMQNSLPNRASGTATASYLEDISSSSFSDFSSNVGNENSITTTPAMNEETENLFNENVDLHRQHNNNQNDTPQSPHSVTTAIVLNQQQQQQQRLHLIDNSNVNEIAENNNNANIERELLDDNSHNNQQHNNEINNDETSESTSTSTSLQESPPAQPSLADSTSTASNAVVQQQQGNNDEANA